MKNTVFGRKEQVKKYHFLKKKISNFKKKVVFLHLSLTLSTPCINIYMFDFFQKVYLLTDFCLE